MLATFRSAPFVSRAEIWGFCYFFRKGNKKVSLLLSLPLSLPLLLILLSYLVLGTHSASAPGSLLIVLGEPYGVVGTKSGSTVQAKCPTSSIILQPYFDSFLNNVIMFITRPERPKPIYNKEWTGVVLSFL